MSPRDFHGVAAWRVGSPLHHAAHPTMASGVTAGLLLRCLGDACFRRDHKASDGGRVLQGDAHDLGRVDDALFEHVAGRDRRGGCRSSVAGTVRGFAAAHAIIGTLHLALAVAQPERVQLDDLLIWRADL